MESEQLPEQAAEVQQTAVPLTDETAPGAAPAWEQIGAGRFMPRRIRGSCKGRALG
jgi:hypothetical protein